MNITKELLIEKAQEGYTVCYADACPLRTQCLRWLVGQQMPHTYSSYRCVNPHFSSVCPIVPIISSIAMARASFRLLCKRISASCSATTDGRRR